MIKILDGATRLHFVVGDPIAQVKSPEAITKALRDRGLNAICVPAHVAPNNLAVFYQSCRAMQNVDSIMVTIPHKIPSTIYCDALSKRSAFLGSVNVIRRTAEGFSGDMLDGIGYVAALREKGCAVAGKRALLCGLGGAGGAIAHALVCNGVNELAVFDADAQRQNDMITRLNALGQANVTIGSRNLTGFDIAINATPTGMKEDDPLPFDINTCPQNLWAGDVITKPVETAWITQARQQGAKVVIGMDMYAKVRDLLVDFIVDGQAPE